MPLYVILLTVGVGEAISCGAVVSGNRFCGNRAFSFWEGFFACSIYDILIDTDLWTFWSYL